MPSRWSGCRTAPGRALPPRATRPGRARRRPGSPSSRQPARLEVLGERPRPPSTASRHFSAAGSARPVPADASSRGHVPAGVDQIPGSSGTHEVCQALGATRPGDDAEPISGWPTWASSASTQVGRERELEAAAERVPVDAAIETFGIASSRSHASPRASTTGPTSPDRPRHGLDVGARGEDLRTAPDHEGSDVAAVDRLADRVLQLQPHLVIDRVGRRPVQTDQTHTVVDLEPDELPHAGYPTVRRGGSLGDGPESVGQRRPGDAERLRRVRGVGRDGIAKSSAAVRETSPEQLREPRGGFDRRERCRRSAPGAERIETRSAIGTTSGPSIAHVPCRGPSLSSTAARTAATSTANTGATDSSVADHERRRRRRSLDRSANQRPPRPYACVDRTTACSIPEFATASSARPFARR